MKPLYIYGVIFAVILIVITLVKSDKKEELTEISASRGNMEMPNDATHQGMNGMGEDTPSKSNVRSDFWTKLENAKREFEKNPNDTLAMKNYAQILEISHKPEKAIELYEKILEVNPNRIDILLALGVNFYNAQNYEKAKAVTQKIVALDGNNLEAKYNLGVIAASQGDNNYAKKVWGELSEKYPNDEIGKLATDALAQINR